MSLNIHTSVAPTLISAYTTDIQYYTASFDTDTASFVHVQFATHMLLIIIRWPVPVLFGGILSSML